MSVGPAARLCAAVPLCSTRSIQMPPPSSAPGGGVLALHEGTGGSVLQKRFIHDDAIATSERLTAIGSGWDRTGRTIHRCCRW